MRDKKKFVYRTLVFLLAAAILVQGVGIFKKTRAQAVGTIIDWGIHFETEGEAPIGNATTEYLAQYNAYYVESTEEKVLYLTFDAGYENGYTEDILDVLKAHNVPAAFFLTGHYVKTNPELMKRIADEGHVIGNHTVNHPDMTTLDFNAFKKEIEEMETKTLIRDYSF